MPIGLIIALLISGGLGIASERALPGDVLYPVKINLNEKFESAFAFSKEQDTLVEIEHFAERIKEIDKLTSKGRLTSEKNKELKKSFEKKIKELSLEIEDLEDDDSEDSSIDEKVEDKKIIQVKKVSDDEDREDEEGDDDWDDDKTVKTTPSPVPVSKPTPTSAGTNFKTFTMVEVSKHNTGSDCYSVVNGSVYNLTSWIGRHPGGTSAIRDMCGVDASAGFNGQHGGQSRPESELVSFKIGIVK